MMLLLPKSQDYVVSTQYIYIFSISQKKKKERERDLY